ncbi:hypothetical protein Taro_028488 [Colocasia esculenta]|uniref:Uncharacterized protein n=1 Tax=Colocasia esculenta TaxID=4460 RepID=A0A843VIQ5_COLES|nr:hypothetical protein [Colocasia esculenta]
MGLKPSLRTRLVAFDHRTLDEALSAACRQEGEMEQYLEEKKASQKRPVATFQRQDKKKMVYQTPQKSMKDYDCILGLDWLEEHYALVDCRRKKIVFRIPEFWLKATLASSLGRLGGVSVQTWTPTLILASNDMDANLSGLHAQQSCKLLKQGKPTIGGCPPTALKTVKLAWFTAVKPCEISNLKHVKRLCVVGDVAPSEEVAETDSERGD